MTARPSVMPQSVTRIAGVTVKQTLMRGKGTLLRVTINNAGGPTPNIIFTTFDNNNNPVYPPVFEIDAAHVTTNGIIPIYRPYTNGLALSSLPMGAAIDVELKGG
jgi:hypothetical protein